MKKPLSAFCLALAFSTIAFAGTINMKLAHYAAVDHPGGIAARKFADAVKARTNGEITIEVYPNNELGAPDDMLEQNVMGVVDMTLGTQGSLDKYSKKFAVVMMPFVFQDYDHAYRVLDGPFYDWTRDELLAQGLVFIGSWDYGFRNLTNSVRPVNKPDDVKGLKVRTPGEIQLQSCIAALGANVQAIPFNELYLALKQGTVDGQENPLSVIYFNKYYEAQKYLALTRHVYNSMNLVISKKVHDSLTPEYRKIIAEESRNAAALMRDMTRNGDDDYIAKLEKEGMIVTRPDTSEFAALMQPSYDAIAKYADNPEYIGTFLKMVEDNR
ncbi:MAG: TRAP transporter substrate-binding protein [Planctomycetota bacterium]|nr:TRAP transporter substrate-binding protein [Planctomycetota bacterium]